MDAFTENILARARERQRLLQDYPDNRSSAVLQESSKAAVSEPNLTEILKIPPKQVQSETNLPSRLSPSKDTFSCSKFKRQNSITRVCSDLQGSPGQQTKTLNIQRDSFEMEIKLNAADNVRLEVEIEERNDDGSQECEEHIGLREESKNRLKRLGKLYAGGEEADISSPIHRTEAKFFQSMEGEKENENNGLEKGPRPKKGLSKLADLANTINQWEDDLSHPSRPIEKKSSSPKKTWKPPAPQPPIEKQALSPHRSTPTRAQKPKAPIPPKIHSVSPKKALFAREDTFTKEEPCQQDATEQTRTDNSVRETEKTTDISSSPKKPPSEPVTVASQSPRKDKILSQNTNNQSNGAIPKQINWDKKVLDTLESQGFTRTQSSSRLIYSYNSQDSTKKKPENQLQNAQANKGFKKNCIAEETVSEIIAIERADVTQKNTDSSSDEVVNPESPSKQFKSGAIANRAAMFERKASEKPIKPSKDPALLTLAERKALFEKNKGEALVPKAAFGMSAPVKVDTTMKACESKFIGASKNKENIVLAQKNIFESNKAHLPTTEFDRSTQKSLKNVNALYKKEPETAKPNDKSLKDVESTTTINTPKSKYPAPPPPMPELKVIPPSSPKIGPKSKLTVPTVAVVHQSGGIASKMAALLENKNKCTISEEQIASKVKEERQKELDMLLNRFNKNKETSDKENEIHEAVSDSEITSESEDEEVDEKTAMLKDKTTAIIQNYNSRKSAEKRKSGSRLSAEADSPNVVSVLEDVKRIKVAQPKAGRLYPNLSDIEATTTDHETRTPTPNEENSYEDNNCDSDDPNTSFGRDIMQAVCKNITPTRKVSYKESSSGSENSSVMDELDEILEEMEDDNSSTGPTPPKQSRHISPKVNHSKPQQSNSFHYKSFTSTSSTSPSSQKSAFQSPRKSNISPRQSTDLPLVVDGDNVISLTHTVSIYRRQQNEVHTPVRHIVRQPVIEETAEPVQDEEVEEKIKLLQEEVNKQQNIIAQTSQALNLCSSTPEFSGSTEQVEAERVLLVATHRRQAALHELQRLKVEGTIRPLNDHSQKVPLEKGTLTISNIVLPMKQKYVTALAAAGGKGHHVVCLIKCGEQVVPTKLVSTVASSSKNPDVDLYVPGTVILNNIYSDFTVTFEVYCLQAQEECLPHEVKYHISKKSSKGLATPKKNKQDSRLVRPPKESPAGPQAVRSSSFALMGYVVFSVQAVSKKVWSLNNTPPMSPLEGSVEMKIHCELAVSVEHRGFLTMFEDVSGFGAWHRRWCLLKGHTLSYWKYPEDEKKMPPIDTIDLKNCITKEVGPVKRDICARLHTVLLERERPAYPQDKETLVMVRKGDKTIIRHLLSADTKEERIMWCNKLNAALTALRMWGTTDH